MGSNAVFAREGRDWDEIKAELAENIAADMPVVDPRVFKPAYFHSDEILAINEQAFALYLHENAIYGGSAYPSLKRYEEEIGAMTLELLNAPVGAGCTLTTGGTESNFMAVKAARDWAREALPGTDRPEMVVPRTAHPSFDKAAGMLGVTVRRMASSPNYAADVDAMADAIGHQTAMIVASAPPYPYGQVDPVPEIAALALHHGLWLHVDGCLGGFALPFVRELRNDFPAFDLGVEGVRSISADVHKYGFAAKGVSTLSLRDATESRFLGQAFDEWPAGLYSTKSLAGSRTGGALAAAWSVMRHLGREGYIENARRMLAIKDVFLDGIRAIDGLDIVGRPDAYHFAFTSEAYDIGAVGDALEEKGWQIGRAREPDSIQLMLNRVHEGGAPTFLSDLAEGVDAVKAGRIRSRGARAVYIT